MNGFRDRMRQHRRELAESAANAERIAVPGGLVDATGHAKADADKAAGGHRDSGQASSADDEAVD